MSKYVGLFRDEGRWWTCTISATTAVPRFSAVETTNLDLVVRGATKAIVAVRSSAKTTDRTQILHGLPTNALTSVPYLINRGLAVAAAFQEQSAQKKGLLLHFHVPSSGRTAEVSLVSFAQEAPSRLLAFAEVIVSPTDYHFAQDFVAAHRTAFDLDLIDAVVCTCSPSDHSELVCCGIRGAFADVPTVVSMGPGTIAKGAALVAKSDYIRLDLYPWSLVVTNVGTGWKYEVASGKSDEVDNRTRNVNRQVNTQEYQCTSDGDVKWSLIEQGIEIESHTFSAKVGKAYTARVEINQSGVASFEVLQDNTRVATKRSR